jgi:hypothetical protein
MKKILNIIFVIILSQFCLAVKTVTLENLNKPETLEVNKDFLYFKDGWNIKIFSTKDFKLVKSFGSKGEGPGEFNGYILSYVFPEYVFVNTPSRITYFSLDGKFLKQKKTTSNFGRFKPLEEEHFIGYSFSYEEGQRMESVYLYDAKFTKVKELYRRKHFIDKNNNMNLIKERPPFFQIYKGKVYLDGVDGVIYVYDKTGKQVDAIKPAIEAIPFTSVHKKRFTDTFANSSNPKTRGFYQNMKDRLLYPEHFPPIRMFHVVDEKIYLMTYTEIDGKNEFIVMDLKGKELKRVLIPIKPFEKGIFVLNYGICNGKLYLIKDNDEKEEWELHIFEI